MAFRRGTTFYFADDTATGLHNIPVQYKFVVRDTNKTYIIDDKTGITGTTTIADAIAAGGLVTELAGGATTETPTISADTTVPEHTGLTITISNWSETDRYNVSVPVGTVTDNEDGTYYWELPYVVTTIDYIFSIYAEAYGELTSQTTEYEVTVLDDVNLSDITIINNDFETNEYSSTNVTHNTTDMVIVDGSYTEKHYTQTGGLADWISSTTTVKTEPEMLADITGSSTNELVANVDESELVDLDITVTDGTHFETYIEVVADDSVVLVINDDTFSESSLTNVSEVGTDISSAHDVFSGAGVASYFFENNCYDASTNYDGTPDAEFAFTTSSKYGTHASTLATNAVMTIPDGVIDTCATAGTAHDYSVSFNFKKSSGGRYLLTFSSAEGIRLNVEGDNTTANKLDAVIYDSGSTAYKITSTNDMSTSEYDFYCITKEGTTFSLYHNDNAVQSISTFTGAGLTTTGADGVGYDTQTLGGDLDNLRFFNRALTAGEVGQLEEENTLVYTAEIASTTNLDHAFKGTLTKPILEETIGIAKADNTMTSKLVTTLSEELYSGTNKTFLYKADITDINLGEAPTSAFVIPDKILRTQIQDTADRLVTSDSTKLVVTGTSAGYETDFITTTQVAEGDEIIIEGESGLAGGVTGTNPYTVLTPNHSNTTKPIHAYKINTKQLTKADDTTIVIESGAGATSFDTHTPISSGDDVRFDDDVELRLGIVDEEEIDIVSSTDPFDWTGDNNNPKLLAKYELDSDATDTTSSYNGTATGGTYENAIFSNGFNNGGNQYIATDIVTTDICTISCFVKPLANVHNMGFYCLKTTNANIQLVSYTNTSTMFSLQTGTGSYDIPNELMPLNEFIHIVASCDGTDVYVYINGVYKASMVLGSSAQFAQTTLGSFDRHTGYCASSILDQVEIYDKDVTATEAMLLSKQQHSMYTANYDTQDPIPTSAVLMSNGLSKFTALDTQAGIIETGDRVEITVSGERIYVDSEYVVETFLDPQTEYVVTIPEQTSAPTTLGLPDRSDTNINPVHTYDGTDVSTEYAELEKEGRVLQRTIVGSNTKIVEPLTSIMLKRPYIFDESITYNWSSFESSDGFE